MRSSELPSLSRLPLVLALVALLTGLAPAMAGAGLPVDVPIVNADFEADSLPAPGADQPTITGWDTTAGGGDGIFRPTVSDYPDGIPSGENVAYVNLPGNRVRQTLTTPLEPATRYRLSVEVGWNGNDPFEGYTIQLRANATILATQTSAVMPRQGEFVTATLEYVSPISHAELGQALEVWLLTPGIQANYDDVRLTAERVGTCAEVLHLPFYRVDTTSPNGTNTLFAVRNLTDSPRTVTVEYHTSLGSLQRTDTEILDAFETRTVSIRDVTGLATGPGGFATGFVRVSTVGAPDRVPVVAGDFFQVDVGNDFATGETMVRSTELCAEASVRSLDFGAGTTLRFFLVQPRGGDPGTDPPSVTVQVRNEQGDPVGGPTQVFSDLQAFELSAADFTDLSFGGLTFDFANSLGGTVYAEYSAQGRFSVGVSSQCEDAPRCLDGGCCPPGAKTATTPPLFYQNDPDVGDCEAAVADSVLNLDSFHFRNACQETHGGALPDGVPGARVLECDENGGDPVVRVEVCCPEP